MTDLKDIVSRVTNFEDNWAHAHFILTLMQFFTDMQNGKNPRLVIEAPPRFGKTTIGNLAFLPWAIAQDPSLNVLSAEYSTDIVNYHGLAVDIIQDTDWYKTLFPEALAKRTGTYETVGTGQHVLSDEIDLFLLNDPVKNISDALDTEKNSNTRTWYLNTVERNLSKRGAVLVIATPFTSDDLTSFVVNELKYDVVKYKAIADSFEYVSRKTGKLVCGNELTTAQVEELNLFLVRKPFDTLPIARLYVDNIKKNSRTLNVNEFNAMYQLTTE